MLLSNTVMYFIILSTAATLFMAGKRDIQTAAEAAVALRPLAGKAAEMLLAVGLIGTGFLAVPILTGSSAYAVAEAFGWEHGLDKKPRSARAFYWVIAAATVAGASMNFAGIKPVKALFVTAVINGMLAPPLLFLILRVSNERKIMGERVNGRALNVLGWVTAVAMSGAAVALVVTWIK
jgi:Mn2+/Fe2+ NRAMP family transporter